MGSETEEAGPDVTPSDQLGVLNCMGPQMQSHEGTCEEATVVETVIVGEKRVTTGVEDGGEVGNRRKKLKHGGYEAEREMRRVAEMVLVLAAMGRMRGGKDPTAVEKEMMEAARAKVVALCAEMAPKDIVPREAFGGVIEDLGLNRLKEYRVGFRPPKLSIAERMALTKRKMEESKAFAAQAASYPSQRSQAGVGAAAENSTTPTTYRVFASDKHGHTPTSAGSSHMPTPAELVSSPASTSWSFQHPGTEVKPAMTSTAFPNNITKDSSASSAPSRVGVHFASDGRPNGPSFSPQVPGQRTLRSATLHLQSQSATSANNWVINKEPDYASVRPDRSANATVPHAMQQVAPGQTSTSVITQTKPGTLPAIHHSNQGVPLAQAPPVSNHHLEISQLVQKLLRPKHPEHSSWTLPPRGYMNKALTCQMCKLIINEVESVLVCDACEKGFHLKCLLPNQKGIPRCEWHCQRCLSISSGKPFPPKYGRVTRNMNAPKVPPNSARVQMPPEKKVGTADERVNQPNAIANGNSDLKNPPEAGGMAAETSSESKIQPGNLMQGNDETSIRTKDDGIKSDHQNDMIGGARTTCVSPAAGPSYDGQPPQVKSEAHQPVPEGESKSPPEPPQVIKTSDDSQALSNHNNVSHVIKMSDDSQVSNNVEVSVPPHGDSNGIVEQNLDDIVKRNERDAARENPHETEDTGALFARAPENGLHNVDWIGDIDCEVDQKKFYRSCCINGVIYNVLDYALFLTNHDKLIPFKLKAMWEDSQTKSKWFTVRCCYFPDDLPKEVGRPGAPESNEVYESNHDTFVRAGLIKGPCEVLPPRKFGEDNEIVRHSQTNDGTQPVFIRKWFYDGSRGVFCPTAS